MAPPEKPKARLMSPVGFASTELFDRLQPVTFRTPPFQMAPPCPSAAVPAPPLGPPPQPVVPLVSYSDSPAPPVIDNPLRLTAVAAPSISNTREPAPLMVSRSAPGPWIVRFLAIGISSANWITWPEISVTLKLRLIVYAPVAGL